jgi:hypothetical protein
VSIKLPGRAANGDGGGSSKSWSGSGSPTDSTSQPRHHFAQSLYDDTARHSNAGGVGPPPAGAAACGSSSANSVSISVPCMEQKLAELLLLSNSPNIDAGRIMAAAGAA